MSMLIQDLKIERKDVSSGLHEGFKLLPILFYLSIVFVFVAYGYFSFLKTKIQKKINSTSAQLAKIKSQKDELDKSRNLNHGMVNKGKEIKWYLNKFNNIHDISYEIFRNINEDNGVVNLDLKVDDKNIIGSDSDSGVSMKINLISQLGKESSQLRKISESLEAIGYQRHGENIKKEDGKANMKVVLKSKKD